MRCTHPSGQYSFVFDFTSKTLYLQHEYGDHQSARRRTLIDDSRLAFLNDMAMRIKPLSDSVITDIKLFRENVQYYWDEIYPEAQKYLQQINKKNIYHYIDTYMATDLAAFVFCHVVTPYAIRTIGTIQSGAAQGIRMGVSYLSLLVGWHTAPYSAPPDNVMAESEDFMDNLYKDMLGQINKDATSTALELTKLAKQVSGEELMAQKAIDQLMQSVTSTVLEEATEQGLTPETLDPSELSISTLSSVANEFSRLVPEIDWSDYGPFGRNSIFTRDAGFQTEDPPPALTPDTGMTFEDYHGPQAWDATTQTYQQPLVAGATQTDALETYAAQTQTQVFQNSMHVQTEYFEPPIAHEATTAHAFVLVSKVLRMFGYSTSSINEDSSEEAEIAASIEELFWQSAKVGSIILAGGGYLFYSSAFLLQLCAAVPGYPVYYFFPSTAQTVTLLAYYDFVNWLSGDTTVISKVMDDLQYIVEVGSNSTDVDIAGGLKKNLGEFISLANDMTTTITVQTSNAVRMGSEVLSGSWIRKVVDKVQKTVKSAQNSVVIAIVAVGISLYFLAS